jgi:Ca-activated chloride channel family protein
MRFESQAYLLLLLIPVFFGICWILLDKRRDQKIQKFFSKENIENLGLIPDSKYKAWVFRSALLLAFSFLVISLARPQFGRKQKSMLVSEHSVVFLIDLSRSMLTKDITPSRLEVVKQEIYNTLNLIADVRVGLVVFAGSVDVVSPMTSDLAAVQTYVESFGVDTVVSQGTQIKAGLEEAKRLFERTTDQTNDDQSKIIVVFSDGETHEDESVSLARDMSKLGYQIFTVGVGTASGGFVPESLDSPNYIRDASGQAVVSKPNFEFMKDLAAQGGGAFYHLSPLSPLGPKIKSRLDKIEGLAASRKKFIVRNEVYQVFILLSLLSMLVAFLMRRLK